ncbi:hypothetical protein GTW69_20525, partial [Streptomyces sp. SID7760]|nr:hypothetical protein [Streptomyces sp. SID7760]
GLPGVDEALLADAARFHADLRGAPPRAELYAISGTGQATAVTARWSGGRLILVPEGDGDGTVPLPDRAGPASDPFAGPFAGS